ncbi:hypothetical protein C5Y96_13060 [Blastopirellula marina]|uniref:Uncharacterized protein n=1 Tax=Blastopirellula marina TaxID=124 RepID=A0A2S8FGG3_9BACT|nr:MULTISPECIES: hypothetical protein [Pirellulaceae]PQO31268.1 hypothetical protein C5Y96_13060 [Blastopirellula marina]RCS51662.1 hypothetical protein DTL36_13070 [Bremerella cremea]
MNDSPYKSPTVVDDEADKVRTIMGEHSYQVAQQLGWATLAAYAQVGMLTVLMLTSWMRDQWKAEVVQLVVMAALIVLVVAVGLGLNSVRHLAGAFQYDNKKRAMLLFLSVIPWLAIISLFIVIDQARHELAAQRVPLAGLGVDWLELSRSVNALFGKTFHEPYPNTEQNQLYNLAFCDDTHLAQMAAIKGSIPWPTLPDLTEANHSWEDYAGNELVDARVRIHHCRLLKLQARTLPPLQVLAVIWEICGDENPVFLACYRRGICIYIDRLGECAMVTTPAPELSEAIDDLLAQADQWLERIAEYNFPRPIPPSNTNARMTLVTTHGTRVIEQAYADLYRHPDASQLLDSIEEVTQAIPDDPQERSL